ncbi:MAG: hypothetical protein CMJ31_09430 [Phycisphaerae bacterium]|nr:hypothetical protein [Phycisphaerae bacterium]
MPRPWRHLLLLTALCAIAYLPGLTNHGLTNWQESVRLAATREMAVADDGRGDWVTPTIHGTPYLAKPPAIYWSQLVIAKLRGADVPTLFDLRLSVALAGWLGVLATYLVARSLLRDDPEAGRLAFWAAAMLATGVLVVRAARIGELDVLLVPLTALAVWGGWRAADSRADCQIANGQMARWVVSVAIGCIAFAGLALTKGPPGMLAAGLAILGGIAAHAWVDERTGPRRLDVMIYIGLLILVGAIVQAVDKARPGSFNEVVGLAFFTLAAIAVSSVVIGLCQPRGAGAVIVRSLRSGWPIGGAVGFGALWVWGEAVRASIGDAAVDAAVSREAGDNLNVLVLTAPSRGLEVVLYGAGLGSVAFIAAVVWMIKDRPRVSAGAVWALAWVVAPLIVYSSLGHGAHRYLLPILPGVCIVGGWWVVNWFRDVVPKTGPRVFGAIVVMLAVGQGWWYGYGREVYYRDRSPRDYVAAVLSDPEVNPKRIASLDVWTPAFDVYAGAPVTPLLDIDMSSDFPHALTPIDAWLERIRASGEPWTVLVRASANPDFPDAPTAIERLRQTALDIREISIPEEASFLADRWRTRMTAVVVTPR